MGKHDRTHRKALEKIASCYEKFDFENVVSVSIEQNLYHKGKLIAQPDLIITHLVGKKTLVSIVEYKSNGGTNGELLERARKQLENAAWWYGRYRKDVDPENILTKIISGSDPKYKGLLK